MKFFANFSLALVAVAVSQIGRIHADSVSTLPCSDVQGIGTFEGLVIPGCRSTESCVKPVDVSQDFSLSFSPSSAGIEPWLRLTVTARALGGNSEVQTIGFRQEEADLSTLVTGTFKFPRIGAELANFDVRFVLESSAGIEICRTYVMAVEEVEAPAFEGCGIDGECEANSYCARDRSGQDRCLCVEGFARSALDGGCFKPEGTAINATCRVPGGQCLFPNSVCSGGTEGDQPFICGCASGSIEQKGQCRIKTSMPCGVDPECVEGAICTKIQAESIGECTCIDTQAQTPDGACTTSVCSILNCWPNAYCSLDENENEKCFCLPDFVPGIVPDTCVKVVGTSIGDTCDTLEAQCDFPNSICSGVPGTPTCECRSNSVAQTNQCRVKADQTCSSDADCVIGARCDAFSGLCRCDDGQWGDVDGKCQIAGPTLCKNPTACPANSYCSPDLNGDDKCTCLPDFVPGIVPDTCVKVVGTSIGDTCDTLEAQCDFPNSICSGVPGTPTCECRSNSVAQTNQCRVKVDEMCSSSAECVVGASCDATSSQCKCEDGQNGDIVGKCPIAGPTTCVDPNVCPPNAYCSFDQNGEDKCYCMPGFEEGLDPATCIQVVGTSLGSTCTTLGAQCDFPNSVCTANGADLLCMCTAQSVEQTNQCRVKVGEGCSSDADCVVEASCDATISQCKCDDGQIPYPDGRCPIGVPTACQDPTACPANSYCSLDHIGDDKCYCMPGFVEGLLPDTCVNVVGTSIGASCTTFGAQCDFPNSVCSGDPAAPTCTCRRYSVPQTNQCRVKVDEACSSSAECVVGASCDDTTNQCKCDDGQNAAADGRCPIAVFID